MTDRRNGDTTTRSLNRQSVVSIMSAWLERFDRTPIRSTAERSIGRWSVESVVVEQHPVTGTERDYDG